MRSCRKDAAAKQYVEPDSSKSLSAGYASHESESESESEEVGAGLQLGKVIEKVDRRRQGEPTPEKSGSDEKSKVCGLEFIEEEDYKTPRQSVKKVLDFTDSISGADYLNLLGEDN